jgi:L-fuconolactonase
MQRIDAHQHYWQISRGDYFWMGPHVAPIMRDVFPVDLAPHLKAAGIASTVVVQAAATVAETEFMLDLADAEPSIAAVVGWVDLGADDVEATLRRLAARPKFRGIRPMLQDIEDTFDVLKPKHLAALKLLPKLNLRLDALAQPRHLPLVAALADHIPELPIVVDHAAKPFIAKGILEPWASDMAALAKRPSVLCKFSGLVTEAGPNWSVAGLKPYADHLIACFGPERLMFGSDWPVCELAATYENWLAAAKELLAGLSPAEQDAVFGGNAARFYGIA